MSGTCQNELENSIVRMEATKLREAIALLGKSADGQRALVDLYRFLERGGNNLSQRNRIAVVRILDHAWSGMAQATVDLIADQLKLESEVKNG